MLLNLNIMRIWKNKSAFCKKSVKKIKKAEILAAERWAGIKPVGGDKTGGLGILRKLRILRILWRAVWYAMPRFDNSWSETRWLSTQPAYPGAPACQMLFFCRT